MDAPGPSDRLAGELDVHRLPHDVVDGATIRYDVRGEGPADVLLVHGHAAHHVWWHLVAPDLERDHRVVRLDLSGHGDSDHRDEYSPAVRVRELLAVLDAVQARRPVLVGHSMGAGSPWWPARSSPTASPGWC